MSKRNWAGLGLAVALLLSVVQFGCGSADDANASTNKAGGEAVAGDESGGAEPASDKNKKSQQGEDDEQDDEKKEEAVPVEVAALARGPIESVLRFSSNLEAESHVEVFSQSKRLVTQLLVEEGDRVRKDQVLLRLQDDEQRSALDKVKVQLAKAEREYTQQQRLYEQELISEQAFNDATFEMDQLKISLEDAQRELGYTEVRAPIAGTVTERVVNLGDQVQIGQKLFSMVDFDSIVALVFVPEKYLRDLRPGLAARISTSATATANYTGSVKRISPVVDPKSGTVKVTVNVGQQAGLRPGMYVDIDLVTATHETALLVPKRAVVYDNDQSFVYRLGQEQRVERVALEPALMDKFHIEPAGGFSEGDRIVVAGQAGLKDGTLVSLPGEKDVSAGTTGAAAVAAERASL